LVFVSVFGLTVLLVIVCVLLALFAQPPTDEIRSLISQFETFMGLGFGAAAGFSQEKRLGRDSRLGHR
jgi:hypothetical protein